MLTLYHIARAVCPQKVRLALAEKGLAYESRLLEREALRSSEYLALNRGGYVLTLVHDGVALTESRTISVKAEPLRTSCAPACRAERSEMWAGGSGAAYFPT
jgi:Glutathione S-transferase, N-terminal domain